MKERKLQEKVDQVKQLQREKAEIERARHTDIVKLRLEVTCQNGHILVTMN